MKQSLFFKSPSQNSIRVDSKNQRIRVADILAADEEEEEEDCVGDFGMDWRRRSDGSTSLQCSSPRRIVARWLAALRRAKERRNVVVRARRSMNSLNAGDSSPSASESEESGQCRKDTSFNLGVGCSLLYLIAASKTELTKMVELRTEMEMLLQNVKDDLQRKDALHKSFESIDTLAYSTTDVQEGSNFNSWLSLQSQTTSYVLPDSGTITVHDQPLKDEYVPDSSTLQQDEYVEGMDELEAELEAELERLQTRLDRDNSLKHPLQERIKVTVDDTDSVRSRSSSFGEVIDLQNASTEVHCGVPPTELQRRLHELLEAKQQERIKELEAALECAMHKLREKEIEASWWKDTARLISQHVPGPSRLSSQPDSETS
ncbi:protein POLAR LOCALIZATION DURING ASYMMETRIC DIVISION AND REDISTRIBUTION-like [Corylus avellana]|uniref:protein POLAR LOCALIZATION DURING ASYMMETRIC DIVISION AND REDISTRIBUTION-like n=1 Tax=Corylus avellana TaxID=13451 RepID=UPI00286AB334|nr:protein POLAR LOCALIZATION DURING ASYMMETRIC DIVISION AND REDISTRIBUTION-like [Corylus avellana]